MVRLDIDLTFKSVCELLKSKSADSGAIEAFDKVAGALLILSPAVLGPAALPSLGLLGAKNELTKLGKHAWEKLKTESVASRLTRFELLSAAYSLTCYTAFFEAFDASMPEIYDGFGLTGPERLRLSGEAASSIGMEEVPRPAGTEQQDLANFSLELPHPTSSLDKDAAKLLRLYHELSEGLSRFIKGLAQWDDASESRRDHIQAVLRELPEKAIEAYKGQYLALCVDYNEFCVWANLREHELTRIRFEKLNTSIQEILTLREESLHEIDLGLKRVAEVIALNMSGLRPAVHSALSDLARTYQARIEEPIIRDEYVGVEGETLRYPAKSETFVPQAFRALRYTKGVGPLEDEKAWNQSPVSEDIGAFLLSYLSSPHSTASPLVALGHPGSGKSLLTEIIAARLGGGDYTPIRVELRDINADSDIQTQLEEQLTRDTGRHVHWADISDACTEAVPFVILDGYDELLQASGRVFSTYLQKVAAFQEREFRLGRPVRVLVTSRITLIDKAEIPSGSTVMRLEDFDVKRQQKWIDTWNSCNYSYFRDRGLEPLALPQLENLRILAQQPLLLLMLALYDSDDNKLASQVSIDQTLLYDSLLRRFIDRERRKGEQGQQFSALPETDRILETNKDMMRLGVAAIGMYNRRALHITKDDLQGDISYFETSRIVPEAGGPVLNQAELLLGSFFFVHESKSRVQSERENQGAGPSAFEFLHNTFGEFLTADFILSAVLEETETIRALRSNSSLEALLSTRLREAKLPHQWYSSLMFTPLYTRPVILAMLTEWGRHRLAALGRDVSEFAEDFDRVLYSQYFRLLQGTGYPALIAGEAPHPFPSKGVVDYLAIFTLNLALIRTAIVGEFPFLESKLTANDSGPVWDRLTHVWRAALGLTALEGLSRVVDSKRCNGTLSLFLRDETVVERSHPLEIAFETASALGDELLECVTGWALQDMVPSSAPDLSRLLSLGASTDYGLAPEVFRRQLLRNEAMYGGKVRMGEGSKPDRHFTASSLRVQAADLLVLEHLGLAFGSQSTPSSEFFLSMPAEFGPLFWRNASLHLVWDEGSSSDRSKDDSILAVIRERALTAAACISSLRSYDAGLGIKNSALRRNDRNHFARDVARVALGMARRDPESLPGEVALELVAYLPLRKIPANLIRVFLGEVTDPWTLATRSNATIRQIIRASIASGEVGLIHQALKEMSAGSAGGPRYVHTCGMSGALSLLEAGAVIGYLQQQEKDPLNGVIHWILRWCDVEDGLQSFQSILYLLNALPDWAHPDLHPDKLRAHFGVMEPEKSISPASLRYLKVLEELHRRGDVHDRYLEVRHRRKIKARR